jgi:hypothetical protein
MQGGGPRGRGEWYKNTVVVGEAGEGRERWGNETNRQNRTEQNKERSIHHEKNEE